MTFVPFHAYEASAGSGKTFSLVVRYLGLLFMDEDPEQILALTFTNKAANEMQERIIATLIDLEGRGELGAISELTGVGSDTILQRRPAVLKRLLEADTKVMTIDKFFAKILRRFSLHAGLMPNFTTFESQHELKVMARFLTQVQVEGLEETLLGLSLLASKRLSDLFALLDELYAKSAELEGIAFEAEPFEPHAQNALQAQRRLRELIESLPVSQRGKSAMEVEDIDELIGKTWLQRESLEYWDYKKYYTPEMDRLLETIQSGVRAYMQARERSMLHGLLSLLKIYIESKRAVARQDGELGFDDITSFVHYLLKERIDSAFLYFRLDSRISHLLLDEFQDTSVVQFDILRPLIEEMRSGSGAREGGSLFLVGDVKQSIYRFRGGTKELFYAVADAYDVRVDRLSTNYRSDRHVVEFVNEVFASRIERYESQQVRNGAGEGYVEVLEDEAPLEAMCERVRQLLAEGAHADEIAVLTATNADGSAVEERLRAEGIDVVTETTSKLLNQKNVRALVEYFKYSYFAEPIYARNFFALIGAEPGPLRRCDPDSGDLAGEAAKVVERYGIYDGDLNLLRFMDILARYKDMEQFIFEHERIDATAAKAELHGVRVLTVHKSKGLEYDYVIVLDRLGKAAPDRSPILYEYEGIALERLFLRMKNRAVLDTGYAAALEKERRLAEEDAMNALYVAFTRAKTHLAVVMKPRDSKFESLGLAVHSRGVRSVSTPTGEAAEQLAPLEYRAERYGTQTEILASAETEEGGYDHHALIFGTALHYALEMLPEFSPASLNHALAASQNRYGAYLDDGDFESIGRRIARLVEHAPFAQLTAGILRREQALTYRGELRYIDLLVETETEWRIIDYKSSKAHGESHRKQVRQYKDAVAEIAAAPARGYLCYLLESGVEIVEV